MSDQLSAAAQALGLPEALVKRSAEARAAETGQSPDEVLAAWAGGEAPAPSAAHTEPASEPEPTSEPVEEAGPEPAPTPEVVVEIPETEPKPATEPRQAGPFRPPILVGARDNPMTILSGVIGLFLIVVMVGLVGPSLQFDAPGARTSRLDYGEPAIRGRELYREVGCAECHTQMVRPVIADVGLGAVTLHDSNQVLGARRFGPDLSNVGARITSSQIEATITGLGGHPAHVLESEDLAALVAYLAESQTLSPEEVES